MIFFYSSIMQKIEDWMSPKYRLTAWLVSVDVSLWHVIPDTVCDHKPAKHKVLFALSALCV